jgi:hypothetical protein
VDVTKNRATQEGSLPTGNVQYGRGEADASYFSLSPHPRTFLELPVRDAIRPDGTAALGPRLHPPTTSSRPPIRRQATLNCFIGRWQIRWRRFLPSQFDESGEQGEHQRASDCE